MEANKIAYSRLVYKDGDASKGTFAIVDDDMFDYGNKIEIKTNDTNDRTPLFTGIVVAQQIKLREKTSSQLIITCKHASVKMSVVSQARYFEELNDQDILEQLFSQHDVNVDVQINDVILHKQIVQYQTTDWDFCLARVKAAGLIMFTKGETVQIVAPSVDSEAVVNLEYGATLLSADIKTDARTQTHKIDARRWDSSDQKISQLSGEIKITESPGDTNAKSLSEATGDQEHILFKPTQSDEELQYLVDATTTTNAINRVTGTLKTIGVGSVFPGDVVTLSGLSKNFNGKALVSGVRHEFDATSGWRTYYQLGGISTETQPSNAHACGLHIGIVVDIVDPDNEFRVKVKLPMLDDTSDGIWARVASIDAGRDRGLYVRPEIEDEVIVGFVQNDMRQATILGMLHSSANPATESPDEENHIKTWVTRSGLSLRFDDDKIALSVSTPNGNVIEISEDDAGISLFDENGSQFIMDRDGITMESTKDIILKASGSIEVNADANIKLSASGDLSAEGSSGATIESSAITVVKGSLVQIN